MGELGQGAAPDALGLRSRGQPHDRRDIRFWLPQHRSHIRKNTICTVGDAKTAASTQDAAASQRVDFRQFTNQSGRRDSNPRHQAWKASALPTELLPQFPTTATARKRPNNMVREGFEPSKACAVRFTV
jgi:hypothetical protein